MRTIILTLGLPASGKSTWAKEQLQKYPGKYKRVNKDIFRDLLDNGSFNVENEIFIEEVRDFIVQKALVNGFDVIIDDTNFGDKHFEAMCDIAKRIGDVRIFEKYFEITVKEAKLRNQNRPNSVPDHVIDNMYEKYIKGIHLQPRDVYFPSRPLLPEMDPAKKNALIVDLDGTLALRTNRDIYDYNKVEDDLLNEPIAQLVRALKDKVDVIIMVSGREDVCFNQSKDWLSVHEIPFNQLFMRKTGDSRKDFIIKKEIYENQIAPFYNVLYVIDDRPQVSRMFRSLELMVLQVNDLEF
jgi:predicted kinase